MSITKIEEAIKSKLKKEVKLLLDQHVDMLENGDKDVNCSRNGFYSKTVNTIVGSIKINMPRLRYYTFDYELLEAEIMNGKFLLLLNLRSSNSKYLIHNLYHDARISNNPQFHDWINL